MAPKPTVLITGAAGFIGRHTARHFAGQGWTVIGVDMEGVERPLEDSPSPMAYHPLALPSPKFMELLQTTSPSACIHCAGSASVGLSMTDPVSDFQANVSLTFEVLHALRQIVPRCRFVFLSSAAVYGNARHIPVPESAPLEPISPYGFHKRLAEQICQEFTQVFGLPTAAARIFSAYGPGLRRQVVWDICRKASANSTIFSLQGTGQESRDFIFVEDIAQALFTIATRAPMKAESYNVASGTSVTIAELADLLIQTLGTSTKPQFDGHVPAGVPLSWQADISKIKDLGFQPSVSIKEGIRSSVEWFQKDGLCVP